MTEDIGSTDMLYMTYEGNWLSECTAKVLAVNNLEDSRVEVFLDRSCLHAQGGGQPTDKGTIRGTSAVSPASDVFCVEIEKVTMNRDTGVATHAGKQTQGDPVQVGDSVEVKIDGDLRRILSECHSAGHVVDSAMEKVGKFLKPSKAYHFLDGPYVEYEGKIAPEEKDSLLADLQKAFTELVEADLRTEIQLMSKEDADALCNRQAQNFDMDIFADKRTQQIRVVTVAGYPCPCGGTHVRSTSELRERKWNVTGLKSKKGVVRVKYGQNVQ